MFLSILDINNLKMKDRSVVRDKKDKSQLRNTLPKGI